MEVMRRSNSAIAGTLLKKGDFVGIFRADGKCSQSKWVPALRVLFRNAIEQDRPCNSDETQECRTDL